MGLEIEVKSSTQGLNIEPNDNRIRVALDLAGVNLGEAVVLDAIKKLQPGKDDAPNIDVTSPLEILNWVGAEALWKTVNGIPLDKSPEKKMVVIPSAEIYALKRAVDSIIQMESFKKNENLAKNQK